MTYTNTLPYFANQVDNSDDNAVAENENQEIGFKPITLFNLMYDDEPQFILGYN